MHNMDEEILEGLVGLPPGLLPDGRKDCQVRHTGEDKVHERTPLPSGMPLSCL